LSQLNACTFFFLLSFYSFSQIGEFEKAVDVGNPKIKGTSHYNEETQTYILEGGGSNIWFNHDEFHFLYKKISGDFILTAHFELMGNEEGNDHRKTGWMIRETIDDDAVSINSCLHGDGLAVLQWRLMRGAYMRDPEDEIFFPKQYFGESIIQLERIGKTITMRMAHPGEPFEEMETLTMPNLNEKVLIGPYVLAHDPDDIQKAKIWNVRISRPVSPNWHPNPLVKTTSHKGFPRGSRVETVNIETQKRTIVHTSDHELNAPFFSQDGTLIYFLDHQKTFCIPLDKNVSKPIFTSNANGIGKKNKLHGFIYFSQGKTSTNQIWRKKSNGTKSTQMTFDLEHSRFPHISPDGKWVAFLSFPHDSNPNEAVRFQRVSLNIMPSKGGAPKTIAHFYGGKGSFENYTWSPDSKSLVFVSTLE